MSLLTQNSIKVSIPSTPTRKNDQFLRRAVSVLGLLAILVLCSSPVWAAHAGDVDLKFGTAGKVDTQFPNPASGRAVVAQPDGKIVAVGGPTGFQIARYLQDGKLDPAFGNGGIRFTVLGPSTNFAHAVALQSDGKIVVTGESGINNPDHGIVVIRLNADGSFDNTFGGDGIVSFELGSNASIGNSVLVQADGKIDVAGSTLIGPDQYDVILARFNSSGALDSSFGANGIVTAHNGTQSLGIKVIQGSDGRLLVGGTTFIAPFGPSGDWDFLMLRYNTNGTPDNSFGAGGKVVSTIGGGQDIINALAIQTDGKIVAAGSVLSDNFDMAIVRYTAAGQFDAGNFGSGGKVLVDFAGRRDYAFGVTLLDQGQIVAVGYSTDGVTSDVIMTAVEADGDLDPTFGVGGKVRVNLGGTPQHVYGIALQPDLLLGHIYGYKLVAVGDGGPAADRFGLARFHVRNGPIARAIINDFDGDIEAELSVFRPSTGEWLIGKLLFPSHTVTSVTTTRWGSSGDRPVPGDYDGDGKYDLAVYRGGNWYVSYSSDNSFHGTQFGLPTDVPVPADFDGDGRMDLAVFRPSNGGWYYLRSADGSFGSVAWGANGDQAVVGDYDGDDLADPAVFRAGIWYILQSSNNQPRYEYFGQAGDKAVPFDFDGDHKTDVGVFRNGDWYEIDSDQHFFRAYHWGQAGDLPMPLQYSGLGKIGIYRNGNWWVNNTGLVWTSGPATDIAVPSYYGQ
jgi:uncharacterized delta-60 repeat protein